MPSATGAPVSYTIHLVVLVPFYSKSVVEVAVCLKDREKTRGVEHNFIVFEAREIPIELAYPKLRNTVFVADILLNKVSRPEELYWL
jgi:hypothetical protein